MVPGSEEQEVGVLDEDGQRYKLQLQDNYWGCNVLHDNIIDLAV